MSIKRSQFQPAIMHTLNDSPFPSTSRREFLHRSGLSVGALALTTLLSEESQAASTLAPKRPPLPCKAKHVIHIFAGGAPSQLDTFDYKPSLEKLRDKTASGFSGVICLLLSSSIEAANRDYLSANSFRISKR